MVLPGEAFVGAKRAGFVRYRADGAVDTVGLNVDEEGWDSSKREGAVASHSLHYPIMLLHLMVFFFLRTQHPAYLRFRRI